MFTGIITDQGEIIETYEAQSGRGFRIATVYDTETIDIGASIACNGVCLTVTKLSDGGAAPWFEVEAWQEALSLTNAADWDKGTILNLERSLRHGDEYGGHMVSGHVDGLAKVTKILDEGEARRFFIEAPADLMKYIVPKGSIALDGTSLTVNSVVDNVFDVLLIRHSMSVTTWGRTAVGDAINLEVDQLARYVVKVAEAYHDAQAAKAE